MEMLYPSESNEQVHRHSSIDQFKGYLSVMSQGGWTPIVFDQLDGITCETIFSHPVVISFVDDVRYTFPEAHCKRFSDKLIYFDKSGVEQQLLPECMGGSGEFYEQFVKSNPFINFDDDSSLGLTGETELRVGLDYVLADKNLPPVD